MTRKRIDATLGFKSIVTHWSLLLQLVRREVEARYRGTALGLVWSFLSPVLLLVVYTFVFSTIFNARWGLQNESKGLFALAAFCGMLGFGVFSEVVAKAPTLIVGNSNLVKRVVFPLELLVPVTLGSAVVQLAIGLFVWCAGWIFVTASLPPATILWFPVVIVPVALYALGCGWLAASLGVFFRDLAQIVGLGLQVLFLVTPIFFPLSRVPERLQTFVQLNPLCDVIENIRSVLVMGQAPQLTSLVASTLCGFVVALIGSWFFARTKGAFADVI